MPRPPSFKSPCRTIREVIGFTQAEMAEQLEVSRNTVVKIENGQMKLPEGLAFRYRLVTGCELRKGGPGEGPLMVSEMWDGAPYTREVFEALQMTYEDPGYLDGLEKNLHRMLSQILERAAASKQTRELIDDFSIFLSSTLKKYGWEDLTSDWTESGEAPPGE